MAVPTARCPDCGMKRATEVVGGVARFVAHRRTAPAPPVWCAGSGKPVELDQQSLLDLADVQGTVAADAVAPSEVTPSAAVTSFLAGFAARTRYGEKPTAEQKRAAAALADRFAAEIARLP